MSVECPGCTQGIKMCYKRPCFGSPAEFDKILDAGFADKLHLEYYGNMVEGIEEFDLLTASIHKTDTDALIANQDPDKYEQYKTNGKEDLTKYPYESNHSGGRRAPWWPQGKCSLLTKENKCSLHELGLKPEQGKTACCKDEQDTSQGNQHYAMQWDNDYGRSVVEKWKQLVNY